MLDNSLAALPDQKLVEMAQAYDNCTDLQAHNRPLYEELKSRNLYDSKVRIQLIAKNEGEGYGAFGNQRLIDMAQKYAGRMELTHADRELREVLELRGLWETALPRRRKKWNADSIKAEAQKYPTSIELSRNNFSAYQWAIKFNMIDDLYPNDAKSDGRARKWTRESINEVARRCKTRTEFHAQYSGAYAAARTMGILEEVCKHMQTAGRKRSPSGMTNAELIQAAKRFNSPNEFLRGNRNAYTQVVRRGIYAKIAAKYNWT